MDSTYSWHGGADVTDVIARSGRCDAQVERLAGGVDQAAHLGRALAARDREAAVGPPAVTYQSAVERDEVTVLDDLGARNAVNDLLIDRDAQRVRESLEPEEARDAVVIADECLGLAVEFEGGHPGAYRAGKLGEAGSEDLPGARIFSISSGRFKRKLTVCMLMPSPP